MATPNINSASDYQAYMTAKNMTDYYQKEREVNAQVQNLVQRGGSKDAIISVYTSNKMAVPTWVNDYVPTQRTTCIDSARSNSSVQASISNKPSVSNVITSPRISYKAEIRIQFTPDNGITVIDIEPEKITYLLHEYMYDDKQIPAIYLGLCVGNSLYNSMVDNKSTGLFRVTIIIKPVETDNLMQKVILDKLFTYIPSIDNPNYSQTVSNNDEYFNDAYQSLTVGLIDPDLDNQGRKAFNGIYNDISTMTALGAAIENTRFPVVELPKYNDIFETLIIPPLTTRMQLIEYIYNKKAFYDTRFRFFMDYDKTYLLSRSGNAVSTGEGLPENIIIDIKALTEDEAFIDGLEIKDGSYYIYVNPAMSNIVQSQGGEKVANQIITVSDEGATNSTNLVINATLNNETKPIYIRDDDAAVYKNAIEEETLGIQIVKQHIDPTIFTLNKSITVSNFGKYVAYDGQYLMISRRDYYTNMAGEFTIACIITLRKVGAISPSRNLETNPNIQSFAPGSTANADTINPAATSTAQTASRSQSSQTQARDTVSSQQTNTARQGSVDAAQHKAMGVANATMTSSFNTSHTQQSSAQVTSTADQRNRNTTQSASRALSTGVYISPTMVRAASSRQQ